MGYDNGGMTEQESQYYYDRARDSHIEKLEQENAELRALCDELAEALDIMTKTCNCMNTGQFDIAYEAITHLDQWRKDNEQD